MEWSTCGLSSTMGTIASRLWFSGQNVAIYSMSELLRNGISQLVMKLYGVSLCGRALWMACRGPLLSSTSRICFTWYWEGSSGIMESDPVTTSIGSHALVILSVALWSKLLPRRSSVDLFVPKRELLPPANTIPVIVCKSLPFQDWSCLARYWQRLLKE